MADIRGLSNNSFCISGLYRWHWNFTSSCGVSHSRALPPVDVILVALKHYYDSSVAKEIKRFYSSMD